MGSGSSRKTEEINSSVVLLCSSLWFVLSISFLLISDDVSRKITYAWWWWGWWWSWWQWRYNDNDNDGDDGDADGDNGDSDNDDDSNNNDDDDDNDARLRCGLNKMGSRSGWFMTKLHHGKDGEVRPSAGVQVIIDNPWTPECPIFQLQKAHLKTMSGIFYSIQFLILILFKCIFMHSSAQCACFWSVVMHGANHGRHKDTLPPCLQNK